MSDGEAIALRVTMIGGQRYPDDFTVIWRGLPIGRIMQANGPPPHVSEWRWTCNFHGKPGDDSGSGVDLDDCKAKFRVAWPRIRAAPSDADIAKAHEMRGADGDHQHRGDQANLFGGQ